jgi:hypothetical protein
MQVEDQPDWAPVFELPLGLISVPVLNGEKVG